MVVVYAILVVSPVNHCIMTNSEDSMIPKLWQADIGDGLHTNFFTLLEVVTPGTGYVHVGTCQIICAYQRSGMMRRVMSNACYLASVWSSLSLQHLVLSTKRDKS